MVRSLIISSLLVFLRVEGFEKLDPKYQIRYGSEGAKRQIVEYFSFSCPLCIELFQKEFLRLKGEMGDSSYVFHPNPVDLTTLRAMVCLKELSEKEKPLFLEALCAVLAETKKSEITSLMKTAMEVFHRAVPDLESLEWIENSETFADALQFIQQEDAITVMPKVEIDGIVYDELPTAAFIRSKMRSL